MDSKNVIYVAVLALVLMFIHIFVTELHNMTDIVYDDTEMYRYEIIRRYEDSLIRATGKGSIDTMTFDTTHFTRMLEMYPIDTIYIK